MEKVDTKQLDYDIMMYDSLIKFHNDQLELFKKRLEQLKERKKSIELYNKKS